MKVGLISDIHGNLPALEAVLEHSGEMKVKQIWNLGDFTGFGANPDKVVLLIKKLKATSLIGNYDAKVLKVPHKMEEWKNQKIPEKWFSFQWSFEHLSKKSIEYLTSLPETHKEEVKGWKILFTHGSPESNEEALTDDTPQERLRDLAKSGHANIILCGHSHQAFMRFAGGSIFINPGSVGRPFDGDPRASYAILSIKKHKVEVDFFRIEYDVEKAAREQEVAGLPAVYAEMTRLGVSLDDLKQKKLSGAVKVSPMEPDVAAEGDDSKKEPSSIAEQKDVLPVADVKKKRTRTKSA